MQQSAHKPVRDIVLAGARKAGEKRLQHVLDRDGWHRRNGSAVLVEETKHALLLAEEKVIHALMRLSSAETMR